MTLGVGAGTVNVAEADRVNQNGELSCVTSAVVGASATGRQVVGERISVLVGTGMTPGAVGTVLGGRVVSLYPCMQVGAVTMSTNFIDS